LAGAALAAWQTAPNGQLSAPMSAPCSGATCTADHLSFILAPAHIGTTSLGTIEVAVKDASGATVTADQRTIQLSINQNAAGFTCTSTLTVTTSNGVATFSGCAETTDASHYIITATDVTSAVTPLASTHTPMFAVVSGPVSHIEPVWWCNASSCPVPPPMAEAGQPFGYVPLVLLLDAQGRVVSSQYTSTISLSITSGTGASGATLSCTNGTTITVQGGYAGFDGCSIDTPGTGYSLTVTAVTSGGTFTGLIGYPTTFDVYSAGTPSQLVFTGYPPAYTSNSLGTITVAVADAGGATIAGDTRNVSLSLSQSLNVPPYAQSVALTCSSGTTVAAVDGIATFTGCTTPAPGSGYSLQAYAPVGNLNGDSPSFSVVPTTQLAFTGYPSSPSTTDLGTITVALEDASGTTVTADNRIVTLSTNQNGSSFTCSGGLSEAAVAGVATFTGCTQATIANGYTITASATGLPDLVGASFDVTSGPAAAIQLYWICNSTSLCPPLAWGAGIPFAWQPGVAVQDASGIGQGHWVTSDNTTQVTLALSGGPGTMTCDQNPQTMTVTAGVAYFSGCKIDQPGTYTLTATSSPQGWTSSRTFTVTGPGTPAMLAFTESPPATTYASFGTVKVTVEDAYGTPVTSDTRSISLQLRQYIASPYSDQQVTLTCSGGTSASAVSGVATFTGCVAPGPGTGYYLWASATGIAGGGTDLFTVIAYPPPPPPPAPATPQIALAVSANPTSLTGSGSVTYTYTVTNPGSVALSGVTVSDTTCSPATYVSGDTNKDGLLGPGETWTYTCSTTLAATTTDAAKATGTGNGSTVSATGAATVTITAPPALTSVTLTDGIAKGVDRGTTGLGTQSLVVPTGSYVTILVRTNPNLAGSLVQIWVESKTTGWHDLTLRLVAADGTVHYFARVSGWTAYWVKFPGDSTHAPAASHGRIATTKS
jgi:uncharacterized repeat protein (TIGR01451 family)